MTHLDTPPEMHAAILHWKRDEPCPLHIAMRLAAMGLDVETLERHYRA